MYDVRDFVSVKGWASMLVIIDGMEYRDGIIISGGYPMKSKLRNLVGDGYAEVSVGVSMGTSQSYGQQKFDSWTTVKLSCDQEEDAIKEAHKLSKELALDLNNELLDEVESLAQARYPV